MGGPSAANFANEVHHHVSCASIVSSLDHCHVATRGELEGLAQLKHRTMVPKPAHLPPTLTRTIYVFQATQAHASSCKRSALWRNHDLTHLVSANPVELPTDGTTAAVPAQTILRVRQRCICRTTRLYIARRPRTTAIFQELSLLFLYSSTLLPQRTPMRGHQSLLD